MPPATSRSATTVAGHAKAVANKQNVHLKSKRKSVATDPALLQGSSDEDREGPQDHEEPETSLMAQAGRRGGSRSTSATSSTRRQGKATNSAIGDASTASPRRSTRLSGEGVGSQQVPTAGPSSGDTRGRRAESVKSAAVTSANGVRPDGSKKRRAPSSNTVANTVGSTHLTPPETDSDAAGRRQPSTSQNKSANTSQGPTSKSKKLKSARGGPPQPKPRRALSPPPSDQSDDSDNFAFTRVDPAPPTSAPSTSKQTSSESSLQVAPPQAARPERTGSAKQQQSQTNRLQAAPTRESSAHTSTSANLLKSLKEVRQNGTKHATTSSTASIPASVRSGEAVIDRKGKRKAEESAEEETEADVAGTHSIDQRSTSTMSSRGPSKGKLKKGRIAELSREDLEDAPHLQPPDPGTPGRSTSSIHVPVNTQETPAIQRNLAMRAGLGYGIPPGTPGSARRSSSDMRGRRGSSIGNGLEAMPHPSLPSDTLYKHIKADDPPAVRFRTLVTWSAHRLKEASQVQSRTASTEVRAAVSGVIDSLIADLVEKRLDLSWQAADPHQDVLAAKLPSNPENEANQAKLESCQAWIERLQEEDRARNARINQYKTMTERITKLMTPLPPSPAVASALIDPSDNQDLLRPNWSLPIPRFKNRSDMLEYGKNLIQSKSSGSSTRRKSAVTPTAETQDSSIVSVQDEYPVDYDEIRHQAASLAQNSYRINQFLKLADSFITQHIAKTQATLLHITRRGTIGGSAAGVGGTAGAGILKGKNEHEDAQSTTRALLEGAAGAGQGVTQNKRTGMDALNVLRAISRADTSKKR